MWYNPKTGNFSLSQPNITEYKMDEITLEMVEVIIGADEDYILVPDKPNEDHYFDNGNWVLNPPIQLSSSELKARGLPYVLNGTIYQVPLDLDAQGIVNAWTTTYIVGVVTGTLTPTTVDTVMKFSNGVRIPITTPDWIAFAEWFKTERGKFFK